MNGSGLIVLWRVYEHCNLRCDFCAYSADLPRPRHTVDEALIERVGALLADFSQATRRPVLLSWLGGEPLLWKALPGHAQRLSKTFGIRMAVTTNGIPLASASTRASLIADYAEVTVSVDGVGAFHDDCRNAPGLYDRIGRHLRRLRAEADQAGSALHIKVNTILMRRNIARFEEFCAEMASWGVRELTFNQLGGNDRPEYYPENRPLPEQIEHFSDRLPAVQSRMTSLGLTLRGSERYLQRLAATARGEAIAVADCAPGRVFLFIDEHGRIAPCSFTAEAYGIPLSDITTWQDLLALPQQFEARRQHRAPECNDCLSTQVFDKFAPSRPVLTAPASPALPDAGRRGLRDHASPTP